MSFWEVLTLRNVLSEWRSMVAVRYRLTDLETIRLRARHDEAAK